MRRQGWTSTAVSEDWQTRYWQLFQRCAIPIMAIAALVWLAYQFWRLVWGSAPIWSSSPVGAVDLMLRYDEVHRWFSGRPVYSELVTAVYPPATNVILWPLIGWLSLSSARWLWAIVTVAALVWFIYLLLHESGADTPLERVFVALLPLAVYPTGATIGNGQIVILLLPALVTGLILLKRRQGWRNDLLVASLMLISLVKPSLSVPFFWIMLFLPGGWRPAILVSLGYLFLTLFAAPFQSPSLLQLIQEWAGRVSGLSMNGGYADLNSLFATLGLEKWGLPFSFLMLAVLGIWVYRNRQKDLWLLLAVTAIFTRFWSYHRWYDDFLLLLPMVAFYRVAKQAPLSKEGKLARVFCVLTLIIMIAPGGLYLLPPPLNTLYGIGQITIWMLGLIFLLHMTRNEKNLEVASLDGQPSGAGPSQSKGRFMPKFR